MKRMAIIIAGAAGIIVVLLLLMSMKTDSDIKGLAQAPVDMNLLADGIYQGKAETTFIKAEVEVETADSRIISIRILKHDSGLGKKAERITDDMVRLNSCDVDVISGATASSRVIRCAVSAALAQGQRK